jgi:uncharacterized protein
VTTEVPIRVTNHPTSPEPVVNVRELLRSPGARKHVDLSWSPADQNDPLGSPVAAIDPGTPVHVVADVDSVVEGLLVTGVVTATVRASCVRCLTEFTDGLRVEVRELFALHPDQAEDDGYAVVAGDRLPLDTMIRDALVLALPAAPLHAPDCAGLCPTCGADRNQLLAAPSSDADCGHNQAPVDPRWAGLAELRGGRQRPDRN